MPFFELAKGDTIAKNVYRLKSKRVDTTTTVLFTSEETSSGLKLYGDSQGMPGKYIHYYIGAYTREYKLNAPPTSSGGMIKIPVDLNEYAGGYYIYLYYQKTSSENEALCYIRASSGRFLRTTPSHWMLDRLGINIGGSVNYWTDMNDGAGGEYIYLEGLRVSNYEKSTTNGGKEFGVVNTPIKDIMIVGTGENEPTFASKMSGCYPGWTMVYKDLNEGAGGSYVYLCYKK